MINRIVAFFLTIFNLFMPVPELDYAKNPVPENTVRVMSYNLKNGVKGEEAVFRRDNYVCEEIAEAMPDSIGTQETSIIWVKQLEKMIGSKYDCVGRARDNINGEYNSIYYLKDKYEVDDSGTFWLSDTPNKVGSKFEESAYIRICTWAILRNKETGECYAHVNTHLDISSEAVKAKQAKIVLEKVEELKAEYPVVLTGDFYIYKGTKNYSLLTSALSDARYAATDITTDKPTFRGWNENDPGRTLSPDIILTSDRVSVKNFYVNDTIVDGIYPSDHCSIYTDVSFN